MLNVRIVSPHTHLPTLGYRRALDVVNIRGAGPIAGGNGVCFICPQAIAAGTNELWEVVSVAAESRALCNDIRARIT
jgi:hypothetical protein